MLQVLTFPTCVRITCSSTQIFGLNLFPNLGKLCVAKNLDNLSEIQFSTDIISGASHAIHTKLVKKCHFHYAKAHAHDTIINLAQYSSMLWFNQNKGRCLWMSVLLFIYLIFCVQPWLILPIPPWHLMAHLCWLLHNTIWQIPAWISARETSTKNLSLFVSPSHITIGWFSCDRCSMWLYARVQHTCNIMNSYS